MIQSYVDLITNSSTTVFQTAGNVEAIKLFIDNILKAGKSKYTCDDLFEIKIKYDIWDAYDYYVKIAKECKDEFSESFLSSIDEEKLHKIYDTLVNSGRAVDLESYAEGESYPSKYEFISKNAEIDIKNLDLINYIFKYDVVYD